VKTFFNVVTLDILKQAQSCLARVFKEAYFWKDLFFEAAPK